jgi:hypothetical protein
VKNITKNINKYGLKNRWDMEKGANAIPKITQSNVLVLAFLKITPF